MSNSVAETGSGLAAPPTGLKLVQAIIIARHGERLPQTHRISSLPTSWNLCHLATRHKSAVATLSGMPGFLETQPLFDQTDSSTTSPKLGDCRPGDLTDLGYERCLRLGARLREHYVNELAFLPTYTPASSTAIHFRSTPYARNIASLDSMISGLYPSQFRIASWAPVLVVRKREWETLFNRRPNCPRLEEMQQAVREATAVRFKEQIKELEPVLAMHLKTNPIKATELFELADTIQSAQAHSIPLPSELQDPHLLNTLSSIRKFLGFKIYDLPSARRISAAPFLAEVLTSFNDVKAARFALMVAHDMTMGGLMATLDVFDGKWPGYASFLEMQLLERDRDVPDAGGGRGQFVRIRFDGQPLALPACAAPGDHLEGEPSVCTLQAFAKTVESMTPADWEGECRSKVDEGGKLAGFT